MVIFCNVNDQSWEESCARYDAMIPQCAPHLMIEGKEKKKWRCVVWTCGRDKFPPLQANKNRTNVCN